MKATKMMKTRIILDAHGYYYIMRITVGKEHVFGIPFACHIICEQKLRRPHFTCPYCRGRAIYMGKKPEKIPVDVIVVTVAKQQRYKILKAAIRKVLFTLAGWTFN